MIKRVAPIFLLLFIVGPHLIEAVYDDDPIKTTRASTVPVTEELVTKEGETAPASPTIRLYDTGLFFVKRPYDKVREEAEKIEDEKPWWQSWFFWLDEDQGEGEAESGSKQTSSGISGSPPP